MMTGGYPSPEHERLAALVGTWKTTGEIKSVGSDPAGKLEGIDSYEWLPGGHFLLHRVNVQMGETRSQSIEVIGVDTTGNGYSMHSFDDLGNHVVTRGVVEGSKWTIVGDEIRFSGKISHEPAVIAGHWERLVDGVWLPWIDVRLARVT